MSSNSEIEKMAFRFLEDKGYYFESFINEGNCGKVYKIIEVNTGSLFACKILTKTKTKSNLILNEANIMQKLSHSNIVKLEHFFETETHYIFIMEYLSGGDLFETLTSLQDNRVPEDYAKWIMLQLGFGVQYLHGQHVSHRDLKIENIVFSDKNRMMVKIVDFELSRNTKIKTNQRCGTAEYMAPEMMTFKEYDEKVDIWSLGCILYVLLFGFFPFDGSDLEEKAKRGEYGIPNYIPVSSSAIDLIKKCLTVDPQLRPTIEEFCLHNWFQELTNQFLLFQSQDHLTSLAVVQETQHVSLIYS